MSEINMTEVEVLTMRVDLAERKLQRFREALRWYGEQSRLARLIHSEGDAGRIALASDGGKRARDLLEAKWEPSA